MKRLLTIAGSDCSGGAGIQADLKTFSAYGVFGMSVIVSVVAENTARVISIQNITPEIISDQIDAIYEDIGTDAVKIGMLSDRDCMEAVAYKLKQYRPEHIVIDPVMYAKNGSPLMKQEAVGTLIRDILPLADILTPNIPEAERITGITIESMQDMEEAAKRIADQGVRHVLIKGGHSLGDEATDILYDGQQMYYFTEKRIHTLNTHGTGCTYSSAIAAGLALSGNLQEAVKQAKAYVTTAIRHSLNLGSGPGPTHHFYDLYQHGLRQSDSTKLI